MALASRARRAALDRYDRDKDVIKSPLAPVSNSRPDGGRVDVGRRVPLQPLLILPHLKLAAAHPNFARTAVGLVVGGTFGLFLGVADALCVDALPRRAASALGGLALGAFAGVLALIASPIVPTVATPVFAGPVPATGSTLGAPMNAHAF